MTQRLFKINSVSVLIKIAPNSSIHFAAGKPNFRLNATLSSFINVSFVTGFGVEQLITPFMSSLSLIKRRILYKSSTWIQLNICSPEPCLPPRPNFTKYLYGVMTPPLPPNTMEILRATCRVFGKVNEKKVCSHCFATSTENPLPISPSISVIARSSACLYIVAVLELIQRPGGFLHSDRAFPNILVVFILELRISALFLSLYLQLTDFPARFINISAFSNASTISCLLSHEIFGDCLEIICTSYPKLLNLFSKYLPIKPV